MFEWAIKDQLVRGPRPRNGNSRLGQVPKSAVNAWLKEAKRGYGVRSIICLLHRQELRRYKEVDEDLVSYYRSQGFAVEHIPQRNHRKLPLSQRDLRMIWKAYERMEKPVLVHCSAGISRTGIAVRYIKARVAESDESNTKLLRPPR